MPDTTGRFADLVRADGQPVDLRLVDNGDGSYSLRIATGATSSVGVAKVAIARSSDGLEAGFTTTSGTFSPVNAVVVAAQEFLYTGTISEGVRSVAVTKTAQASAVANGADVTVWTPAAGKRWRLRVVNAAASVAGRYELRDGASTLICSFRLVANTWISVLALPPNGLLSAAANNVLLLRNASGSAADIDVFAAGNEE
jgi:hypothetical protein